VSAKRVVSRSVDSSTGERFAPATSLRSAAAVRRELTELIAAGRIVAAVQPIVRLYDATSIGYEALARFPPTEHFTTPDELFSAAASLDVKGAVDIACVRAALREAPNLGDIDLFVNVLIRTLMDDRGMRALRTAVDEARLDPASIVLEFSERDPVPDLDHLQRIASDLRADGYRIAVDDAGAGHASMRVIAELRPEFIKVDRSLIHGVDTDRARRALIVSLLSFGGHIGARLIAEGVETQAEEDALQSLGVQFGQGWHLGRPVLAQPVEGHEDVEVVIPGWFAQRPVSRVRSAPEGPLLHLAQASTLPAVQPNPSRVRRGLPRALSDAALALQTEHDPMRILGVMAEQLSRVVPVSEMAIFVADYDTHQFQPVLATGVDRDEILADAFSLDAGMTGWAFAKGIPENVDDTADHPLARQVPGTPVVHESLLLIPLVAAERKLGIINCWRIGTGQFTARELEAASLFAHIAAAAWRNAQLYTELLSAAMTDSLTGLYNSRWLRDAAQRELLRATRDDIPFSLMLIDLDHFKKVNDNGGHGAGDLVLQRVSTRLRATVRGADAVVRLGGEEFVILLHGCDIDGAAVAAEGVREAISQLALPDSTRLHRLTASIGVASHPQHGTHLDQLLSAADRAMYAAKRGGRNRVMRAPLPHPGVVTLPIPTVARRRRAAVNTPRRTG
jgi:diguanylate cyclase (GGDEF)-like protein